jgi:hypothetical protein
MTVTKRMAKRLKVLFLKDCVLDGGTQVPAGISAMVFMEEDGNGSVHLQPTKDIPVIFKTPEGDVAITDGTLIVMRVNVKKMLASQGLVDVMEAKGKNG